MGGWIKLDKGILNMPGYFDEKFNLPMCLIDMMLMADCNKKTIIKVRGIGVELRSGQLAISQRDLAKRWSITRYAVQKYLEIFENQGYISIKSEAHIDIITVFQPKIVPQNQPKNQPKNINLNSSKSLNYNIQECDIQPQNQPQNQPNIIPQDEVLPLKYIKTNKTIKNKEIKEKEIAAHAATTEERKKKFYDSLKPYLEKYGKEMLRDFFDYWSETTRSGTKMRCELQPTWQTASRLATWNRRNEDKSEEKNKIAPQDIGKIQRADKETERKILAKGGF